MKRLLLLLLFLASPALAQSPGTMSLAGPSSSSSNPKITPQALDAAINAQLATKLNATNPSVSGSLTLPITSAPCLSTTSTGVVQSSGCNGTVPNASLLGGSSGNFVPVSPGNCTVTNNVLNCPGSGGGGAGSVTSVGLTMPSIFSVANQPVTGNGTIVVTGNGTSGGLVYFNSATGLASSPLYNLNAPLLGGGAGNPPVQGTRSGNTTTFATANGTLTNGHCVSIDANGNFQDAGGACTTGGGGGTVSSGTAGQLAVYSSTGTVISGVAPSGDVSAFNVSTGAFTVNSVNGGKAISLGGNLTTSGAFNLVLTLSGTTGLTLPTSGTLLTTTGSGSGLTGLTYSQLPALTANQLLGALTATTASGLNVPSCSGVSNALTWTSGTGFGCNTVGGGAGVNGTPVAGHLASWYSATALQDAGAISSLTGNGVIAQDTSSNANLVVPGAANSVLMSTGTSSLPSFQSLPMPLPTFFRGVPPASDFRRVIVTYNGTLPAGLTGSKAIAKTGATAATTITINKISAGTTTAVGTVVFAASGGANQAATFTMASSTSLAPGDMIEWVAPSTPDTTLADIAITLAGTHL